MNAAVTTTSLIFLATAVTKVVDFLRNSFDSEVHAPKWVWNLAAVALGIAVALIFQVNMIGFALKIENSSHLQGIFGQVLTGIALAGGSGFMHELLDNLSSGAKAKGAQAEQAAIPPAPAGN